MSQASRTLEDTSQDPDHRTPASYSGHHHTSNRLLFTQCSLKSLCFNPFFFWKNQTKAHCGLKEHRCATDHDHNLQFLFLSHHPQPPIDSHRWVLCGKQMPKLNSTLVPWPCQYLVPVSTWFLDINSKVPNNITWKNMKMPLSISQWPQTVCSRSVYIDAMVCPKIHSCVVNERSSLRGLAFSVTRTWKESHPVSFGWVIYLCEEHLYWDALVTHVVHAHHAHPSHTDANGRATPVETSSPLSNENHYSLERLHMRICVCAHTHRHSQTQWPHLHVPLHIQYLVMANCGHLFIVCPQTSHNSHQYFFSNA